MENPYEDYPELRDYEEPEPTVFVNKRTGKTQTCRLESADWDDPMMVASGCAGEFSNDWRVADLRDGCPRCTAEVEDNLSEPDVMERWGLR